jgi:hypothetical protein
MLLGVALGAPHEDPPRVVDDQGLESKILEGAKLLREEKLTTPLATLRGQLNRRSFAITLPAHPARTTPLTPAELFERSRDGVLIMAAVYSCGECGDPHKDAATAFAIAADIAVTNYHVVNRDGQEKGTLIAMTSDGTVYPVSEVLAADQKNDVAIVRLKGATLTPLPLGDYAKVGSEVAVISHPTARYYTFTRGSVSRFSVRRTPSGSATVMETTAQFAPGSSGGPVIDAYGRVVGVVSSISRGEVRSAKQRGEGVRDEEGYSDEEPDRGDWDREGPPEGDGGPPWGDGPPPWGDGPPPWLHGDAPRWGEMVFKECIPAPFVRALIRAPGEPEPTRTH